MKYCNHCHKIEQFCGCSHPQIVNNITSEQAGRDGLDAKAIMIRAGRLREGATDQEFIDAITGPAGAEGGVYTDTEW